MIPRLTSALVFAACAAVATAAPQTFDFKDPKGVNSIQFHLDSVLEPISAAAKTSGKIVVATNSLVVPNSTMTGHLQGKGWLNAEENPEIVFEIAGLSDVKTSGDTTTATAQGSFTLNGTTKEIAVPVKLTVIPDGVGKRLGKPELKGDLLVVRGNFTIDREAYGLQPGKNLDKVAKEIELTIAMVGGSS